MDTNMSFTKTLIVHRSIEDVFSMWNQLDRFPEFMENVIEVTLIDSFRSHWVVRGPLGSEIKWDAETTTLDPNTRIAWKAKGEHLTVTGQVVFTALPHAETQLTVTIHVAPEGVIRALTTQAFANVEGRVQTDLQNFKKYMEGMPERLSTTQLDT